LLKRIFLLILIFGSLKSFGETKRFVLEKGNLFMLAPPGANKDYFLLEFGFSTKKEVKSWKYQYNAYVNAAIFQDWLTTGKASAGALGFKAGVMLPSQPWIPLLGTLSLGYAKTVLHRDPFLGKDENSLDEKHMILIEAGALLHIKDYFIRYAYQVSNVKYFSRHSILMIGVNY
jgi:hypothetical protein